MIVPFKIYICYLHPTYVEYALRFQKLLRDECLRFTDSRGIGENLSETEIKDNHIRNAVATAVLIGPESASSGKLDCEIFASLMKTDRYLHTGLFGVLLPNCPAASPAQVKEDCIPPRLADNLRTGFADLYLWREDPALMRAWIQRAVSKRDTILPDNSRVPLNGKFHHSFSYSKK